MSYVELLGSGSGGAVRLRILGSGARELAGLGVWEPRVGKILVLFWIECTRIMQFYLMENDNFGQNALLIFFYSFTRWKLICS